LLLGTELGLSLSLLVGGDEGRDEGTLLVSGLVGDELGTVLGI